jgi:hypothetical protein
VEDRVREEKKANPATHPYYLAMPRVRRPGSGLSGTPVWRADCLAAGQRQAALLSAQQH